LKNTILIADDEEKICQVVRKYLEKENFNVIECSNGLDAIKEFKKGHPDLVVLDIMMPGADGWEVCRELRKTSDVPIIMLTAREDEIDRILGLEMGADDYVVKPFSPRELVARVKAVLRRVTDKESPNDKRTILNYEGISINLDTRQVIVNNKDITLTLKEFDILYILAEAPGRIFTREKILEIVWGYDYIGDARTVDTHINRLRDKLSKAAGDVSYVNTVWGVGYKFDPPAGNNN